MQIKKVVNHSNTRWRVSTYVAGKRKQRFFSSKKLAVEWMKLLRVDESCGNFWSEISIEEQRDILSAYKLAASKGLSVYRCVLQTPTQLELKPLSVSDAILEYQEVIKQRSLRPRRCKRKSFKKFSYFYSKSKYVWSDKKFNSRRNSCYMKRSKFKFCW